MNEIYAAIYARLTAQLSVNVYDHVPQDIGVYPFVRLDQVNSFNSDVDDKSGFTASVQVVTYSQYRGGKEVADLADSIYNALHRYNMPDTATYGISGIIETLRNTNVQGDGLTRHSVQQFEIIFETLPV